MFKQSSKVRSGHSCIDVLADLLLDRSVEGFADFGLGDDQWIVDHYHGGCSEACPNGA